MEAHLQDCRKQVNSVEGLKKQNDIQMHMDEEIKKLLKPTELNFIPLTRLVISHKDFKVLAVFLFFSLTRENISEYIKRQDNIFNKIIAKPEKQGEKLSQEQIDILNKLKIVKAQNKTQQSKCLVEQFIRRFQKDLKNGINYNLELYQKVAAVLDQMDCVSLLRKILSNRLPQISIIINKNQKKDISQIHINKKNVQNLQNCVIIKKYSEQDSKIIIYSRIQNRLDLQNQGMTAESKIKLNQKLEKKRSQQYQQQLSKNEQSQQTGFHKKKQASSENQIPTSQKTANPPKPQSQIASQPQTLQHIRDSNEQHSSSDPPAPAKPAISRANTQPISPYHQSQQEAPPYPSPSGSGPGSGSGKGSGSGFNRSQSLNNQTILEQRIQIPEKYRLSWFEFAILIIILFAIAGQFGLLDNVLREYNRNVGRYYGIETGYRIGKFFYGKVVDTNATTQL